MYCIVVRSFDHISSYLILKWRYDRQNNCQATVYRACSSTSYTWYLFLRCSCLRTAILFSFRSFIDAVINYVRIFTHVFLVFCFFVPPTFGISFSPHRSPLSAMYSLVLALGLVTRDGRRLAFSINRKRDRRCFSQNRKIGLNNRFFPAGFNRLTENRFIRLWRVKYFKILKSRGGFP